MAKKRVFELAKETGLSNKELVAKIQSMGIEVKNHMSSLDEFQVDKVRKTLNIGGPTEIVEKRVTKTVIRRRVRKGGEPAREKEALAEQEGEIQAEASQKGKVSKKKRTLKGEAEPEPKKLEVVSAEDQSSLAPEKLKKVGKERVLTEFTLEKGKKTPSKPLYQTLKVVPQKIEVDKEGERRKETVKAEKIRKLKERFKPSVGREDFDLYPVRGFEKIKSRRRREVIDIKELKGSKFVKKRKVPKRGKKTTLTTPKAIKRVIKIDESIQVGEMAKRMSVKASELIAKLLSMGTVVTITQTIDSDTASIVAAEFGFTVEKASVGEADILEKAQVSSGEKIRRPPVVTVMGHVDHGKTSLLDKIRKTSVTSTEAGGITQRIGAYSVDVRGSKVVFIDTPGHEAFTSMRARGARVTDIVVLVVAADDGVMPQTVEAINHAREANVPILVAINKIDKPGSDPQKVKQNLTEYGLVPEEWGGENILVGVSAKTGEGIPELLDMIVLQAEVLDLMTDPEKLMKGIVIESRLDKGKGPVATVIVQEGTLKLGQPIVIGSTYGKARAMQNENEEPVKVAGPSMPVEIQGLSEVPEAGEVCYVLSDERLARQVSELRMKKTRSADDAKPKISLEDLYAQIQQGNLKELKLVIKADTAGSVEAVKNSLTKLGGENVGVKCIHEGVGGVTERDLMLAAASNALVIGFNVRMEASAASVAEREKVDVRFYDVIYEAIDEVKKAIEGLLEPKIVEKTVGRAKVKEVFNISKVGTIAGSMVVDGKINRGTNVRLLRDAKVVFAGKIFSLKRFKDDVKNVQAGQECGIGIESFSDIKVGDVIECYEIEEIKPSLI